MRDSSMVSASTNAARLFASAHSITHMCVVESGLGMAFTVKPTHRLIGGSGVYSSYETATSKRESLGTPDKREATHLLAARMQSIL